MRHDPTSPLSASRFARLHRASPSLLRTALACVLLGGLCMPAGATTLVRCKINHKIVYSDTDCPAEGSSSSRRSGFGGMPLSKPITIRYPRTKTRSTSASRKTASR